MKMRELRRLRDLALIGARLPASMTLDRLEARLEKLRAKSKARRAGEASTTTTPSEGTAPAAPEPLDVRTLSRADMLDYMAARGLSIDPDKLGEVREPTTRPANPAIVKVAADRAAAAQKAHDEQLKAGALKDGMAASVGDFTKRLQDLGIRGLDVGLLREPTPVAPADAPTTTIDVAARRAEILASVQKRVWAARTAGKPFDFMGGLSRLEYEIWTTEQQRPGRGPAAGYGGTPAGASAGAWGK
jgi:hypothetical protein